MKYGTLMTKKSHLDDEKRHLDEELRHIEELLKFYLETLCFLVAFSEVDSLKEAEERRRDILRSFFSFCLRASSLAYSFASALALAMRLRFWALTRLAR